MTNTFLLTTTDLLIMTAIIVLATIIVSKLISSRLMQADGTFVINLTDPNKETFALQIHLSADELANLTDKDYLILDVRKEG